VVQTLRGHTGEVTALAFLPGGKRLLTASSDHTLRLWEIPSAKTVAVFEGNEQVVGWIAVSTNGRVAVSGGSQCKVWDIASRKPLWTLSEQVVRAATFTPDGKHLLVASADRSPRLYEVATGKLVREIDVGGRLWYAALTPDGKRALLETPSLQLWDLQAGKGLRTLFPRKPDDSGWWRLAISNDGKWGMTGGRDGSIWLWDLESGKRARPFIGKGAPEEIWSLAFSADGQLALTGGTGGRVKLWDVATGKQVRDLVNDDDW
jgi:WD40 repeat protein